MTKNTTTSEIVPNLTPIDLHQLAQKDLAKGAWAEGRPEDALLMIEVLLAEEMSPAVRCECLVAKAAFIAETGDFWGCLEALSEAAPLIDQASTYVRGCFFFQRARAHKETQQFDAALTDYAGAASFLREAGAIANAAAVLKNLAGLYLVTGDVTRAREVIDNALQVTQNLDPAELCQYHDTNAQVLLAEGKLAMALVEIEKAISTVGNNEKYLKDFLATRDSIKARITDLLIQSMKVPDLKQIEMKMLERALTLSGGSVTKAGEIMGITHKAVASLVENHPEYAHLRKPVRVRRKSLMKREML